jgi:hypothetical protein
MRLEAVRVNKTFFGSAAGGLCFIGNEKQGGIRGKQILGSFATPQDAVPVIVNGKVIKTLGKAEQAYFAFYPLGEIGAVPVGVPRVYPYLPVKRNFRKDCRFHRGNYGADRIPASRRKKAVERPNRGAGSIIQTGGRAAKIKGYLKLFKGFSYALKGRPFILFQEETLCRK